MTLRVFVALAMIIIPLDAHSTQPSPGPRAAPLVAIPRLQPSRDTVVLSFDDDVSLQQVFHDIGQQSGIVILFDEAFSDQTTNVALGTVSVEDALDKLTMTHRLFYKIIDSKTVLIIPNNAQKHRQYDDMLLHTFYVQHGDVNGLANMFRTIAGIQRVQPDPLQKSITVRATPDQLLVAESILARNDFRPAEVTFQIEILAMDLDAGGLARTAFTSEEFNRFKNEQRVEVLVVQTIRIADNRRGTISIEEGGLRPVATELTSKDASPREEQPADAPEVRRAVGFQLTLHPQVSPDGNIMVSLTLQATIPAGDEAGSGSSGGLVRTRDVTTTALMKPGEVTVLPAMSRVKDFGSALADRDEARHVVVAFGASQWRRGDIPDVLPPLQIGTEERIRVPQL